MVCPGQHAAPTARGTDAWRRSSTMRNAPRPHRPLEGLAMQDLAWEPQDGGAAGLQWRRRALAARNAGGLVPCNLPLCCADIDATGTPNDAVSSTFAATSPCGTHPLQQRIDPQTPESSPQAPQPGSLLTVCAPSRPPTTCGLEAATGCVCVWVCAALADLGAPLPDAAATPPASSLQSKAHLRERT